MAQMQELQAAAKLRTRRDKKRRQEAKHKARVRAAQLALSTPASAYQLAKWQCCHGSLLVWRIAASPCSCVS